MIRQSIAATCLLMLSAVSHASTTICKGGGGLGGVASIAWDTETKVAKVSPYPDESLSGRLTLIRPHNSGFKWNIIVEHPAPRYGDDVTEYMIFSMPKPGHYRMMSVGYTVRNGQRHVNVAMPVEDVTCETL
jgi:hypothetical protein